MVSEQDASMASRIEKINETIEGLINEIFMGDKSPSIVYIPPGIFHGTKNIGVDISVVIGMPSLLYDINDVDERRIWGFKAIGYFKL